MSWRVVVVSSNAKVDYKMDYITVRTLEETRRVHISEIGVLMLESTAISITAYALCELLPSSGSHDSTAKIRQQMEWTQAAKAAVWTEIIRAKILGQRDVLLRWQRPQAQLLTGYLGQIQLGDASNREGHAAKVYFNALFGKEFSRALDTPENAALNYGYGLVLSAINREIAAAGYLTQLGVFHDNVYNAFNLGCDLMEPLRPLIDNEVMNLRPETFEKEHKHALIRLLQAQVRLDGKQHVLLYALRLYCASVFRALQSGKIDELRLIEYEL